MSGDGVLVEVGGAFFIPENLLIKDLIVLNL